MPKKIPLNKGQRFVILHAGCKTGFLPGCELVFKTLSTDGRDYHYPSSCKVFQGLYFDNFKEWFFSKVTRNFLIETYSFFEKKYSPY
jgi:hypothetical protein